MKAYFYLMRLHRPIPILIILYPTLWGLFAATPALPNLKSFIIFVLGVVIMRTAGCIFIDIADRNFDAQVRRTATRPLATGDISVKRAVLAGFILLLIAFFLVLQLNILTILLSLFALVLALSYPFFKRFFAIPQLVLGFAFNFGIIMAYASLTNTVPLAAWILYLATIFWTISYDTIYALADKAYDLRLNLHSSAITFGKYIILIIITFQVLTILCLILFSYMQHYNTLFYLSLLIVTGLFFCQHKTLGGKGIINCIKAFSDNHWVGLVILLAILTQ